MILAAAARRPAATRMPATTRARDAAATHGRRRRCGALEAQAGELRHGAEHRGQLGTKGLRDRALLKAKGVQRREVVQQQAERRAKAKGAQRAAAKGDAHAGVGACHRRRTRLWDEADEAGRARGRPGWAAAVLRWAGGGGGDVARLPVQQPPLA